MENPIQMDDLGVPPFMETSKWTQTNKLKHGRDQVYSVLDLIPRPISCISIPWPSVARSPATE